MTPALVSSRMIPLSANKSRISSARAKFFAFLAACLSSINASISSSRSSSFFSVIIPRISQSCTIMSRSCCAYALLPLSAVTLLSSFFPSPRNQLLSKNYPKMCLKSTGDIQIPFNFSNILYFIIIKLLHNYWE